VISENEAPGGPEEHYVEVGHRHWPLLKIVSVLALVLIIFGAGVAVGRGNTHLWGAKTPSTTGNLDYSSVNTVYNLLNAKFDGNLNQAKLTDGLNISIQLMPKLSTMNFLARLPVSELN
jgi:hypothetical protein